MQNNKVRFVVTQLPSFQKHNACAEGESSIMKRYKLFWNGIDIIYILNIIEMSGNNW